VPAHPYIISRPARAKAPHWQIIQKGTEKKQKNAVVQKATHYHLVDKIKTFVAPIHCQD